MQQEETIDVLAYLQRLMKFVIPGLVVALLVAIPLGLKSAQTTTTYTQKAHVLVLPPKVTSEGDATQQAQLIPMMLRSYVALEDSPAFIDGVVAKGGGKWTPEDVATRMSIVWGGGSALLAFHATGEDLDDTNALANASAEVFVETAKTMVPADKLWNPTLQVVETSKQHSLPKSQGGGIAAALGGGLVAGLLTMAVLEAVSAARRRRARAARA
ncbi:hypothetical protein [Luteococcus sp. OSA5]|uniref:hypothetical protein n=1 Tax=Luteococcus sp. OSA5 TaxID=3401630 RepID=UPI003B42D5E4